MANRELDEANKTKTRFISNVSHDLLTPVSSIIGYCGLQPPPIDGIRINAYQLTRQIRAILERPPPKTSPTKSITKSSILSICCARWRQS
ncbi:histidine kinase dimerization/phospho-acceptor domain-containing protein [Xanthomonas campestris]|uniref:histidine kinase dimerization/phospho-acceptor domain-containing protein n=1 Tax=Xanthomonas campestris TaxID=339 RepID=UPI0030F38571